MKFDLKKNLIALIALLVFTSNSNAQNATIKGKVIDSKDNQPLVGANILFKNGEGVSTDINGFYSLNLPSGKYVIAFKYIGYTTENKVIYLNASETKVINISH